MEEPYFDHERLRVYQEAIAFVAWWGELAERIPGRPPAKEQLDRASTSTPLNIAEGNGKYSPRDRARYFDIARGSALECASCLDVLVARRNVTAPEVVKGKQHLRSIVNMLVKLIGAVTDRISEEPAGYSVAPLEQEQE
jgi:four helix bundle protein